MHFSRKIFIVALVPALILFSVLMWVICHHAFAGRVPVETVDRKGSEWKPTEHVVVYYCEDPEDGMLSCATMTFFDPSENMVFTLSIEGDMLVQYENAMYFVKTLWKNDGSVLLCSFFESLTGVSVSSSRMTDIRDLLPEGKRDLYLRRSDLVEFLSTIYPEATVQELPLCVTVHDEYKLVDLFRTREFFGSH